MDQAPIYLKAKNADCLLKVKIKPGSRINKIKKIIAIQISPDQFSHALAVDIKSPPTQGKANLEVVKFLAKTFKVPQNTIEITHGLTSKEKTILIHQTSAETIQITLTEKGILYPFKT